MNFFSAKWFKYCWLTKDPAFCSEDSNNDHSNNDHSKNNYKNSCPHVEALKESFCPAAGRKPICWSPGIKTL
jgi:hypothetical protein